MSAPAKLPSDTAPALEIVHAPAESSPEKPLRKRKTKAQKARETAESIKGAMHRVLVPEMGAALAISNSFRDSGIDGKDDFPGLLAALGETGGKVAKGDLTTCERMAVAQASALGMLFGRLVASAFNLKDQYGHAFERTMRVALRAQAQSARTLEVLAALKNPAVFAKQLNMSSGPQLVANAPVAVGVMPSQPAPQASPAPEAEALPESTSVDAIVCSAQIAPQISARA